MLAFYCLYSVSCWGSDLLKNMSLEEKVGQLLMVHFHGETINRDAKILVQEVKVGGIIYYNWSNGLTSPEQVQTLSAALQELTKGNRESIPLLIAADQEGGIVCC
jgi:beta-N-acetylhexosaminidase